MCWCGRAIRLQYICGLPARALGRSPEHWLMNSTTAPGTFGPVSQSAVCVAACTSLYIWWWCICIMLLLALISSNVSESHTTRPAFTLPSQDTQEVRRGWCLHAHHDTGILCLPNRGRHRAGRLADVGHQQAARGRAGPARTTRGGVTTLLLRLAGRSASAPVSAGPPVAATRSKRLPT